MTQEVNETAKGSGVLPKKQIERSAAYPAISIEDAIKFVESILKNFPGNPSPFVKREDVAAVLRTKAHNIQRDIAAASQYNFLNRQKDSYQVSELFKKIYNHLSEAEKRKCLLEAFGSPKLYQEILAKHDGHVIPTELKTHLIRFHKIAEKAAPEVAELFIENAKFSGAANEHNILGYKIELEKLNRGEVEYAEVFTEKSNTNTNTPLPQSGNVLNIIQKPNEENKHPEQLFLPEIPNAENVKIPLSEKKTAYLSYPPNIKKKDIEILRKQLDLLELLAE